MPNNQHTFSTMAADLVVGIDVGMTGMYRTWSIISQICAIASKRWADDISLQALGLPINRKAMQNQQLSHGAKT